MKKFQFRFQTTLELREKKLEDVQISFSKIKNKLYLQNQSLESLYEKVKSAQKDLEEVLGKDNNIEFQTINNYQNFINKLKEDIVNQHKLIADTEVELSEEQKLLTEALKDKTVIEKLKEKDYNSFLKEIEVNDLKQIDEIATSRFNKTD